MTTCKFQSGKLLEVLHQSTEKQNCSEAETPGDVEQLRPQAEASSAKEAIVERQEQQLQQAEQASEKQAREAKPSRLGTDAEAADDAYLWPKRRCRGSGA